MESAVIERISDGNAVLLKTSVICSRLGVSRTTFDRWRNIGYFPPPDVRIGNSPKWDIETFKQWLHGCVARRV